MNKGLTPNSVRLDAPFSVDGWTPDNADHQFRGPITLREAFASSRNTVATRVGLEVGIDSVWKEAHELGIRSLLGHDPSLVLGTFEVTLIELTAAYVPFMNEGRAIQPYAARMALDSSGQVFYRRDAAPQAPVVNPKTLHAMRDMLRAVVTEGTGHNALLRGLWSGGKTGTSQGNRDAWFVGLTDRVTTGIWFGNDDNSQMTNVSGASMPADTWRQFNEAINAPAGFGQPDDPPRLAGATAASPRADRNPPERRVQVATRMGPVHRRKHDGWRERPDQSPRGRAMPAIKAL